MLFPTKLFFSLHSSLGEEIQTHSMKENKNATMKYEWQPDCTFKTGRGAMWNRDNQVLKAADSSGGTNVTVGQSASATVTQKTPINFTLLQFGVTEIASDINGLLLITLQYFVW